MSWAGVGEEAKRSVPRQTSQLSPVWLTLYSLERSKTLIIRTFSTLGSHAYRLQQVAGDITNLLNSQKHKAKKNHQTRRPFVLTRGRKQTTLPVVSTWMTRWGHGVKVRTEEETVHPVLRRFYGQPSQLSAGCRETASGTVEWMLPSHMGVGSRMDYAQSWGIESLLHGQNLDSAVSVWRSSKVDVTDETKASPPQSCPSMPWSYSRKGYCGWASWWWNIWAWEGLNRREVVFHKTTICLVSQRNIATYSLLLADGFMLPTKTLFLCHIMRVVERSCLLRRYAHLLVPEIWKRNLREFDQVRNWQLCRVMQSPLSRHRTNQSCPLRHTHAVSYIHDLLFTLNTSPVLTQSVVWMPALQGATKLQGLQIRRIATNSFMIDKDSRVHIQLLW